MSESEKIFEDIFKIELEPTLLELGFSRYNLPKGWMQPSFLLKHNSKNIWFGCSWDWRDFDFEADLGNLYKFKDVMPRVIICGFAFERKCSTEYTTHEYIKEQIINTKSRIIDLANKDFEKYYKFISDAQNEKKHRLNFYIQKEIILVEELPFIL